MQKKLAMQAAAGGGPQENIGDTLSKENKKQVRVADRARRVNRGCHGPSSRPVTAAPLLLSPLRPPDRDSDQDQEGAARGDVRASRPRLLESTARALIYCDFLVRLAGGSSLSSPMRALSRCRACRQPAAKARRQRRAGVRAGKARRARGAPSRQPERRSWDLLSIGEPDDGEFRVCVVIFSTWHQIPNHKSLRFQNSSLPDSKT